MKGIAIKSFFFFSFYKITFYDLNLTISQKKGIEIQQTYQRMYKNRILASPVEIW